MLQKSPGGKLAEEFMPRNTASAVRLRPLISSRLRRRAWEVRGLEWDEGEQGMKGGGVAMPARSFAMPWRLLQG